jgi:hypothetical protein
MTMLRVPELVRARRESFSSLSATFSVLSILIVSVMLLSLDTSSLHIQHTLYKKLTIFSSPAAYL